MRLPRLLDGTPAPRNRVAGRNRSSRSRADTVCFRRQDRERRAAEAAPGTVRIQAGRACSARDDREEGLGRARTGSRAAGPGQRSAGGAQLAFVQIRTETHWEGRGSPTESPDVKSKIKITGCFLNPKLETAASTGLRVSP